MSQPIGWCGLETAHPPLRWSEGNIIMKFNPFILFFFLISIFTFSNPNDLTAATYKKFKDDKIQFEYPATWAVMQKNNVITFKNNEGKEIFRIKVISASFEEAAEEAAFVRVEKWKLLGRQGIEGEVEEISNNNWRGLIGETMVGIHSSVGYEGLGFATVAMVTDGVTSAIISGESTGNEEGKKILDSMSLKTQTQRDMQDGTCGEFKKADAELNRIYKKILSEYKDDKTFLEKLKKAQRAWLTYRDAHIESIYPIEDKAAEYGSVYGMCNCTTKKDLTEQRTKMLKQWLVGVMEGDVCSSSIKVNK
jgi:uncharacterized protein YecT (DUF1311 family)